MGAVPRLFFGLAVVDVNDARGLALAAFEC